jgi:hypothetical protein
MVSLQLHEIAAAMILHPSNMVQLLDDRPGPRDYWKPRDGIYLQASDLRRESQKHSFFVFENTSTVRLTTLFTRCQRGMTSYEGSTLDDLKRFAAHRVLTPPDGERTDSGRSRHNWNRPMTKQPSIASLICFPSFAC